MDAECTHDQFTTCLRMLWRLEFEAFDCILDLARCVGGLLAAQSAAVTRADFCERLSADLKLYASCAHKLTPPPPPSP